MTGAALASRLPAEAEQVAVSTPAEARHSVQSTPRCARRRARRERGWAPLVAGISGTGGGGAISGIGGGGVFIGGGGSSGFSSGERRRDRHHLFEGRGPIWSDEPAPGRRFLYLRGWWRGRRGGGSGDGASGFAGTMAGASELGDGPQLVLARAHQSRRALRAAPAEARPLGCARFVGRGWLLGCQLGGLDRRMCYRGPLMVLA